jgi:hypothetical protein
MLHEVGDAAFPKDGDTSVCCRPVGGPVGQQAGVPPLNVRDGLLGLFLFGGSSLLKEK